MAISALERLCFNLSLEAFDDCCSSNERWWSIIGRAGAFCATTGQPLGEVGLVLRIDFDMPPGVVGLRMLSPSFIRWLYFSRLLRILPIWLVFAWSRLTISPFCVSSCSHSYKVNMSRNGVHAIRRNHPRWRRPRRNTKAPAISDVRPRHKKSTQIIMLFCTINKGLHKIYDSLWRWDHC